MERDRLVDVYAIQQLKARYFRYLDAKEWDLWRVLFTDDLYFAVEESIRPDQTTKMRQGGDAFVVRVSKALETAITVHHGHMPDIEFIGPGEATAVWAMNDWVDDADKGYAMRGWGHYHEKYRKQSTGEWQISELRLTRLRRETIEPTRPDEGRVWPAPWTPK
jgi:hypothetical protein